VGFGLKYLNFVQLVIPVASMWLVIAAPSFAIIMLRYEVMVRRHNTLRFLFGMKQQPKAAHVPAAEAALAGGKIR
jgi:hypothetical protein